MSASGSKQVSPMVIFDPSSHSHKGKVGRKPSAGANRLVRIRTLAPRNWPDLNTRSLLRELRGNSTKQAEAEKTKPAEAGF